MQSSVSSKIPKKKSSSGTKPRQERSDDVLGAQGSSQNHSDHPVRSSKVAKYIKEMQGRQEVSRALALERRPDLSLSLEDLYLGAEDVTDGENQLSPETTKLELRKSLRALKEKDMVINSLREACQDLSLKCADAENTIDEMRFRGHGVAGSSGRRGGESSLRGSESSLKKSKSERVLCPKVTKDQATETTVDVLSECCSSWMEKVKYWKTDSMFHASADADSGFRESDLADHDVPNPRVRRGTTGSLLQRAQMNRNEIETRREMDTENEEKYHTENETKFHAENETGGDAEIEPKPETNVTEIQNKYEMTRASLISSTPIVQRRSRSHTNLHWPTLSPEVPIRPQRVSMNFDRFESLDKLLAEATAHARLVRKKSQRLSQLIQSTDKKV